MSQFHWPDYLVFVAMLVVSMATGVYFAYTGRKNQNAEEFLMAGRSMHVLPVSFSLFVSLLSGVAFIGDPVECYRYGFIYVMMGAGYVVGCFLASFFAPTFHEMRITSAYEFLEVRYSKAMRLFCSLASICVTVMWLGIVTYAPALALSQASGIQVWQSIILIGLVCTFYASLGGMKAILWADTIQMGIMFAGQVAVVVRGCIRVGGVAEVVRIASQGGRINFKESWTEFNPLSRASLWIFFFGGIVRVFCPLVSHQMSIQRYCSVRTHRDARLVVLLAMPMFGVMYTLIGCVGVIMYALYSDCDPVLNGKVQRWDQMVVYLVIDLLGFLPGIPGLFLAAVFAASLSSMSSGMNGIAAMLLKDFAAPMYQQYTGTHLSCRLETILAKVFGIAAGIAIIAFAFLPFVMGTSIFVMTSLVGGVVLSPIAGVFCVALCMPRVKSLFVHIACAVSVALCVVVGVMKVVLPPRTPWEELPLTTSGCPHDNVTISLYNVTSISPNPTEIYHSNLTFDNTDNEKPPFSLRNIHHMNALIYNMLGLVVVILVSGAFHLLSCCKDWFAGSKHDPQYENTPHAQCNHEMDVKRDQVYNPTAWHNLD